MLPYKEFLDAGDSLQGKRWIFAKTMPQWPHWYTLKRDWQDKKAFEDIVVLIREHGYKWRFYSREGLYLNINGFKYWTMGDTIPNTILINRAEIPKSPPCKTEVEAVVSLQGARVLTVRGTTSEKYGIPFEEFANGYFDLILAPKGIASYIAPQYLSRVKEMLKPNGKAILSFRERMGEITHFACGVEWVHDARAGVQIFENAQKEVTQSETIITLCG